MCYPTNIVVGYYRRGLIIRACLLVIRQGREEVRQGLVVLGKEGDLVGVA